MLKRLLVWRPYMYSDTTYKLVGGVMGFILVPLALLGFGTPFYLRASMESRLLIGWSFLAIALLILLCNGYMEARRVLSCDGGSFIPAIFSLAAIPALVLLAVDMSFVAKVGVSLLIVAMDFIGPALIGNALSTMFRSRA